MSSTPAWTSLSASFHRGSLTRCSIYAIHPDTLNKAEDDVLHYSRDLSSSFLHQLLAFRACFKSEIAKKPTVKDMAKMLIVENCTIAASFTDVCTALMLYLTIPVTVVSAERSFSKLKLIKTYLRSSMGQERLSELAILSIENCRARALDLSSVINDLAEHKACKVTF